MGDQQDYGMRFYDPRVGRFLSVDPTTEEYPELTPYQFASNMPIIAIDLDGLEAKIAIAGQGSPLKAPYGPGGTDYTPADIWAFGDRANSMKSLGFTVSRVHNGKMIVDQFVKATKEQGSILAVISYTHSGANGLYLDNDGGFYTSNIDKLSSTNDANIADIAQLVKQGQVKFDKNAVWIMGSCNCGNPGGTSNQGEYNLAEDAARELGIITYGATDKVEPEFTKNGKETGRLTTHGTFIKFTPVDTKVTRTVEKPVTFLGIQLWTKTQTETFIQRTIKKEDVGNTIDPKAILKTTTQLKKPS